MSEKISNYNDAAYHLEQIVKALEEQRIPLDSIPKAVKNILALTHFMNTCLRQQELELRRLLEEIKKRQVTLFTESKDDSDQSQITKGAEKRRYKRAPVMIDVTLFSQGEKMMARMTDISYGGFFVDSIIVLQLETEVDFIFKLSGQDIKGSGIVRSSIEQFGMGIEFTKINPFDQDLIMQHIFSS